MAYLAKMAEMAINRQRHSLRGYFGHLIWIAGPLAIFRHFAIIAKIANFAKIATLQGATFGIQFESPAFCQFSAIARISGHKCFSPLEPQSPENS